MKTKKLLAVTLFALISVANTLTAQLVWDGTSSPWTHGTGTASDPYLIETSQNLAWLSDMVNNGLSNYSGVYFKQTEDFNMNGSNYQFNVIGSNTNGGTYFSGHYDGNFKSIFNLVISDLSQYVGLFGYTNNATLEKICVKGISGSGSSYNKTNVGAICGIAVNSTIIQCSCIGDVMLQETSANTGTLSIGGLVGYAEFATLEQCFMRGNVKSARYYSNSYIGGLIGYARGRSEFHNGPVTATGLPVVINSCFFYGNLELSGTSYNNYCASAGLFIGQLVTGTSNSAYSYTIFFYEIYHSYAIGGFSFFSSIGCCMRIDEMIGGNVDNTYITSYFNSYSGTNLTSTSTYATYRADAYMKSAAMPTLLNSGLDSTVFYYDSLNVNDGYPIFSYQKPIRYWVNASFDATMGSVTGMGSYASGSTATLRAMPAEGYIFSGWSDGSTENPRTVTVTSDSTYTANFTKNAYNIYIKQDCTVEVE